MTDYDISLVLEHNLQQALDGEIIDIAYENVLYEPTSGRPWIAASLIPGPQDPVSITTVSKNRHRGFYQLNLYVPQDEGMYNVGYFAGKLSSVFKRGATLTAPSSTALVRVLRFRFEINAVTEDGWYTQIFRIEYRADIDN